jgi:hypothetical protein
MPDETTEEVPVSKVFTPKVKKGLSVTGKSLVGLSIPAIITMMITMVPDIYKDMREQRAAQRAGYETLAPTVKDLQDDAEEFQKWAKGTSEHHGKQQRTIDRLKKKNWKLEQRIYQIELALQARRIRVAPAATDAPGDPPNLVSLVDPHDNLPAPPKLKKKRPVPKSLGGAKHYQEQRVQMKCAPGDPLCGSD